jgi:hypothetical protein
VLSRAKPASIVKCVSLRSLYKLSSRYAEAEDHVRKYIGMMERLGSGVTVRREMATAYSLLASIYDLVRPAPCLRLLSSNHACV